MHRFFSFSRSSEEEHPSAVILNKNTHQEKLSAFFQKSPIIGGRRESERARGDVERACGVFLIFYAWMKSVLIEPFKM